MTRTHFESSKEKEMNRSDNHKFASKNDQVVGCNNCDFNGTENDLSFVMDDEEIVKACPRCKTDAYLFDIYGEPEEELTIQYNGKLRATFS